MLKIPSGVLSFQYISMLGSFLKVAFRVLIRNRSFTLINIFGLAIGLSFSIIIFLYAHKELSYDRFHEKSDRIYRVGVNAQITGSKLNIAFTSTPLAHTMLDEISQVEDVTRVARFGAWLLRNDSIRFNEDNLIFSDPSFFRIFSFPLTEGSADLALTNPNSIVLTESAAHRYFGEGRAFGKRLRVENDSTYYTVTGVMKDVPETSHLKFDMVGAISTYEKMLANDRWIIHYLSTYFVLKEGNSITDVENGLEKIVENHVIPDYQKLHDLQNVQSFHDQGYYHFIAQPVKDIHLDSVYSGDSNPMGKYFYINMFIVLAFVIMVLSCLNFISLLTAQSVNRAREVGIRKISGSERQTLIKQFLLESSVLAFLALMLALFFTELALPPFSRFIGLKLSLAQLLNSSGVLLLFALILFIGIISGIYPALYLSSYDPRTVLRNRFEEHSDKGRVRTGLTIFQLVLAVGALTMTLIVMSQFRYLVNKDRGYETENLVVIRRPDALTNRLEKFKEEINKHPGVEAVSNATSAMGTGFPRFSYYIQGTSASRSFSSPTLLVSNDFDSTYRLATSKGRFFNRSEAADSFACVINETAVKTMGLDQPLGKMLVQLSDKPGKTITYKIIGVVRDFNFETLENPIEPLIMILMPGNFEGYLTVRLTPQEQDKTISYIKGVWESYTDAYPFVYYFLDQDRRDYYKPVLTTARIFLLLSLITALMACLSLFALVSFTYNQKQRQIGILKALGASKIQILLHRAGEIVLLVLFSSVLAWICAFFLARYWLSDYANHINMNVVYFICASFIITILSLLAVYYHTSMAAKANPASVLKYE